MTTLNAECYCRTLDRQALRRSLLENAESGELMEQLLAQRPTLFSSTAVFLSQNTIGQVAAGVASLERVIRSAAYQASALQQAPSIASLDFGPLGVFASCDFHLAEPWHAALGAACEAGAGFGARAAYRGDKLTRRVWGEILAGTCIAQALVVPAERAAALRRCSGSTAAARTEARARLPLISQPRPRARTPPRSPVQNCLRCETPVAMKARPCRSRSS